MEAPRWAMFPSCFGNPHDPQSLETCCEGRASQQWGGNEGTEAGGEKAGADTH